MKFDQGLMTLTDTKIHDKFIDLASSSELYFMLLFSITHPEGLIRPNN